MKHIIKNILERNVRNSINVQHNVDKLVKEDGTLMCSDHEVANDH